MFHVRVDDSQTEFQSPRVRASRVEGVFARLRCSHPLSEASFIPLILAVGPEPTLVVSGKYATRFKEWLCFLAVISL